MIPEDIGIKPLDCPMCLSFWIGLLFGLITGTFFVALQTACLALLAERIIYKNEWL
jgi:hypothetical protein